MNNIKNILSKIASLLYSTKTMALAIVVYALAMAVATFVENDYGTKAAKALIYNTKWFEFIHLIMFIGFLGNIFRYKLYKKTKIPVLLFHIGFIIIILGSFITRYYSFEGVMPIREGAVSSTIYSDNTYITIRVDNNNVLKNYSEVVFFNNLTSSRFSLKDNFGNTENIIPFKIELKNFIANIKTSLKEDDTGYNYIHLVESSTGQRNNIYLKEGEIKNIRNILFSFNNPIDGAMNFSNKNGNIFLQANFDGKVTIMKNQESFKIYKDSIQNLYQGSLYEFDKLAFVIPRVTRGKIVITSASKEEKEKYPFDALIFSLKSGNEEKEIEVKGAQGALSQPYKVSLNGLNFQLSYGSIKYKIPFSLKLRDFQMERYPGTNSASSYASEVTVIDKDKTFNYRIFMNNVLDYKGYRFFQASYDRDEKGTLLSVNHDYFGTLITYIGYFILGLSMFFTLFWKGTRFDIISKKLKKISNKTILFILFAFSCTSFYGQEHLHKINTENTKLSENTIKKSHADKFGRLLIQDHQGRIKPINTYALDALRKIYKKDNFKGLNAEQILLSAQLNPKFWSEQKIIKVKTTQLGEKLTKELDAEDGYATMVSFFKEGNYFIENRVNEAFRKKNSSRNQTDKEIINLDERANIWWSILNGSLLNIYPKEKDANNKWHSGTNQKVFTQKDTMVLVMHRKYLEELYIANKYGDYTQANIKLDVISDYQRNIAENLIPTRRKIDLEIKYNKFEIFKKLLFYYLILGLFFLTITFIKLFSKDSKLINKLLILCTVLTILGLIVHATGMALIWYISGHVPWSNGYETVIFISWVTIIAGLIFSLKSNKFTLAATVIFASFLLGIAHGSLMNPEITNLVPVLKSYWLMIHVAIITSSYGFLSLGALLGFINLLLYILRNKKNKERLNKTIDELTYINELSLTVGLFTLTLGTFLGGVWANESWGRYWSWDPKEVWSLISIMIYTFVLHMRLVPKLNNKFTFNLASLFSVSTLVMTFFGVNYYLSGMHSYAKGDPVPVPNWIYLTVIFLILFSILSKYKKTQNS